MLLLPKHRKYRKDQKGSRDLRGLKWRGGGNQLKYGVYGIKAMKPHNTKSSHIEAVRRVSTRNIKRFGHIVIRASPYKPISGKPTKVRMGKGKGSVRYWACPVKRGQVLFEIRGGSSERAAKEVPAKACHKLPISTKIVTHNSAQLP